MLATAQLSDRLSVDLQNLQGLRAKAQANDPESLREAARQFEALMVQTMLKTMRDTRFTSEDDPFADTSSLRMYRELLDQHWAQKLAEGRGLGFAEAMVRQMQRYAGAPAAEGTGVRADGAAAPARPLPAAPAAESPILVPPPVPATVNPGQAAGVPSETTGGPVQDRKQSFLDRLRPHAEAAARQTGVPAHFILGHAALESGWGAKEIAGKDGGASHNLFGIKAGAGWRGRVAETLTTEYQAGLPVKRTEQFRAYGDYTEAFADYARLLKERYGAALNTGNDAQAFARALAGGGYASDPDYGDKLSRVIASVARAGA